MMLISIVSIAQDTSHTASQPKDSIERVFNPGTNNDTVRLNEVIGIKINTTKPITFFNTLYLNGIRIEQMKPWKISQPEQTVFFKIDGGVSDLTAQFIGKKATNNNVIPAYFSVGNETEAVPTMQTPVFLLIKQKIKTLWVWLMLTILLILTVVSLRKNILKDDNNLYYSLGRTQLFYWTLIFAVCYLILCFRTDTLPDIPRSVLIILGISVATTAAAKVIENKVNDTVKIDPDAKSEGFLYDILSDGTSINVQRFQNVVFNLAFGLIFIQRTFTTQMLPSFDDNVLLLLGISSGAFAGLKITEAQKDQTKPPPPVGTDTEKKSDEGKTDGKLSVKKETKVDES
jgi:hypothetical protein